ncbi:hypothetical protein Kpol_1061p9 [Vanderwaltozyma polyspora DSM 70294]|uniref:SMP-30/Gluconolactonase/LRE-like region domain-containing protein n=1 Tax=Vanderwaltozyma polyspora (strain ATCC 22028 / DSM 70294 / BCRC 21397 / CBS 2163 / NBRC 10782 / NRRL Y-8283 / UCD 57-17) TaxID=436907 RepID=A7TJD7_VANPO|nr:uncharacterized protein Kpol_1061p9 [Vanderwaltozyma polyspora DSM 70294]EDO17587.1 hypothetical protein Kpol_1061p9 [Vanderwaltozyma polyspora DSM 70294]
MSVADYSQLPIFYHDKTAKLSEGVSVYHDMLFWVDIFKAEIHTLDNIDKVEGHRMFKITPETYDGEYPFTKFNCKESVGVVFPIDKTSAMFGSRFGIGKIDLNTGKWKYLVTYDQCKDLTYDRFSRLRSNDGNVSPCGKFILMGLMNSFEFQVTDEGCILLYDIEKNALTMFYDHIKIPNSIHWDGKNNDIVYITDSLNFVIWKYNHKTQEKQLLIDFINNGSNKGFASPEPDGSIVDYHTNVIYVSVWSTSKVQAYDLETGNLLQQFKIPQARASCCCIYKEDIIVTTANLNIEHPTNQADPIGGALYRIPNGRIHPTGDKPNHDDSKVVPVLN